MRVPDAELNADPERVLADIRAMLANAGASAGPRDRGD